MRRLSVGEIALGVALLALVGFVTSQVVESPLRTRTVGAVRELSASDSLSIAEQYQRHLASRESVYGAPEWLARVHIARLQASAARDVDTPDTAPPQTPDSVRAVLGDAANGSYLDAMLAEDGNVVMRWQIRDEPIRVWMQPHSSEAGFSASLIAPARRGFTAWNELGLDVQFAMVDDSTAADVHVTWSAAMAKPTQIGTTFRMTGGAGWLSFAHVVLSTSYDIYAVQNAARHEAGHALGLGHSPDARDIMTAVSEGRQYQITGADQRTALLLYRLPAGELPAGTRQDDN